MERAQKRMTTGSDPFDEFALDKWSLGEAGEVVKRASNEPLPAWVLSLGSGGE
jgi:hypothetical protein